MATKAFKDLSVDEKLNVLHGMLLQHEAPVNGIAIRVDEILGRLKKVESRLEKAEPPKKPKR